MADNPFERYEIDPREGVVAVTERLKELIEDARTDAERDAMRAAWEELTLHPARRLRAALEAHPETRVPLGGPPPPPRLRPATLAEFEFEELAARPSAEAALRSLPAFADVRAVEEDVPSLDEDPYV